jgi:hypothetical protein
LLGKIFLKKLVIVMVVHPLLASPAMMPAVSRIGNAVG